MYMHENGGLNHEHIIAYTLRNWQSTCINGLPFQVPGNYIYIYIYILVCALLHCMVYRGILRSTFITYPKGLGYSGPHYSENRGPPPLFLLNNKCQPLEYPFRLGIHCKNARLTKVNVVTATQHSVGVHIAWISDDCLVAVTSRSQHDHVHSH